jgi:hypothetical protein
MEGATGILNDPINLRGAEDDRVNQRRHIVDGAVGVVWLRPHRDGQKTELEDGGEAKRNETRD